MRLSCPQGGRGYIEHSIYFPLSPCGGGSGLVRWRGPDERALTMSLSDPFIKRPVATFLLTFEVLLGGYTAYRQLPVTSLPAGHLPNRRVHGSLRRARSHSIASAGAEPPDVPRRPIAQ